MSFDPTAAVIVHSLALDSEGNPSLDAAVLETLKAEDGLLIHSCTATASRQTSRAVDTNGDCFLRVDMDATLRFQVSASVLQATGLADYHPGRKLSAQALSFANGADLPFQFKQLGAVLIYESPTLNPGPGDLPSIEFGVAVEFSDLDRATYPPLVTDGGPGSSYFQPTAFVSMPAMAAALELSPASRNALLLDLFNSVPAFGSSPLTATLYDGDPEGDGTAVSEDLSFANPAIAGTYDEPSLAYSTRWRNATAVRWLQNAAADRTVSHIRIQRGAVEILDIPLATPLTVPAYQGVEAPINALMVKLTWPVDGVAYTAADMPARRFLPYVMGGARADHVASANIYLEWWDGDSEAAGTNPDSIPAIAADGTNFTVVGVTVTPTVQTSPNAAPPGGWNATYVALYINGGARLAKEQYAIAAAEAAFLSLNGTPPPALMVLNLAAAPDV